MLLYRGVRRKVAEHRKPQPKNKKKQNKIPLPHLRQGDLAQEK